MAELTERFDPAPLIPPSLQEERARDLERLGMPVPVVYQPATRWEYHVDYLSMVAPEPDDPHRRLRHKLMRGRPDTKYFVSGSRGAGKSTVLNAIRVDPEIRARYSVIGFSVYDYLNLDDASAEQLIAVLIALVVEAIQAHEGLAKAGLAEAKHALADLRALLDRALPNVKLESVDIKLFGLAAAKFKESGGVRDTFRQYMGRNPTVVLDLLDQLLEILRRAEGKDVLLIVDDLDKVADPDAQDDFFSTKLTHILRPRCRALYTYPMELERDPHYSSLKEQKMRVVLRNVKLIAGPDDDTLLPDGVRVLAAFLERRLEGPIADYIDPSILPMIYRYSSGNFRELARIVGLGFECADMLERDRMDDECLGSALKILRRDYASFLPSYRSVLRTVADRTDEDIPPQMLAPLIQSLAVVEFPNDPGWLGVHPIIADLLGARAD